MIGSQKLTTFIKRTTLATSFLNSMFPLFVGDHPEASCGPGRGAVHNATEPAAARRTALPDQQQQRQHGLLQHLHRSAGCHRPREQRSVGRRYLSPSILTRTSLASPANPVKWNNDFP